MPDTLIMNGNRPGAKGRATASVALSVPMIVAGALAIVLPPETTEGVAKLVGCVFILVGATNLALLWQRCPGGWHRATTLLIILDIGAVIAGGYVLLHPQSDFALLTYLVLMYLLGDSILQFILRDRLRRLSGSSWLRFEGTANSLILGILLVVVWTVWPAIPRQVIGVLVGISMLSSGIARLMISLAPPRAVETVHEEYHEVP